MNGNQAEETVRTVAGEAEETAGRFMGDKGMQARGKARKMAGQAQGALDDAADTVRSVASDQPIMALLLAAGVGLAIGMVIARR